MKDSIFSKKIVAVFALLSAVFVSCASSNVEVPEDASKLEIVQMAQTALDGGKSKKALAYYNVLLQRYGMDTATYIEGTFEIAHIYVKKKKYDKAEPLLREVLEIYNSSQPGQFPGAYQKLAQKDLEKIEEKN
jgi:outer membrane protein assembly factor BamD (BamD/ComL family)